jgi:hypothetical protein
MLDLKAAFPAFAQSRRVGFSNRSKTVGSSEIGQCARRVVYEKKLGAKGYDKDYTDGGGYAVRGDIIEDHVLIPLIRIALEKQCPDAKLIWAEQKEQRTLTAENWKMSATPDGLFVNVPRHFLAKYGVSDIHSSVVSLEGKSFDPRKNTDKFPAPEHVAQLNQAMGLIRAEGEWSPVWGIIVYVNASDVSDIRVFPVRFDQEVFDDQKARALALMSAESPELIRPEGKIAGGHECDTCPFAGRCTGYTHVVPRKRVETEKLPKGMREQLMNAVGTYDNTSRQLEQLEEAREHAKATIKELLVKAETYAAEGVMRRDKRRFEVYWRKNGGRRTYDMDKLLEAFIELGGDPEDYLKLGKASDQLVVKFFDPPAEKEAQKEAVKTE